MKNREQYNILNLEAIVQTDYAAIYYKPNGNKNKITLIDIIFRHEQDTIYEAIEDWLDDEAHDPIAEYSDLTLEDNNSII